ncbi:MAG: 6-phosphogluconolactonase [Planctomycetota bacterium]
MPDEHHDPAIYSIDDDAPPTPALPGEVITRPDAEALHGALGADLLVHAENCVRRFGDFHLAVSGGSTPMPFYRRLMVDPAFRHLPWTRTHLWIVDERRVPFDDERSNFAAIDGLLGTHADMPEGNVHPMLATRDDAADHYERELREHLAWREKGHDRLDFVLLGMGGDAHTASLFPRSPALGAPDDRFVVINDGPAVTPPDRVTMTYTLINAARFIAVLVTGEGKRDTIATIAAADASAHEDLPILGVKPVGGSLRWYLDHAACPEPA